MKLNVVHLIFPIMLFSSCIGSDFIDTKEEEPIVPGDNTIYFSGDVIISDTLTTLSRQNIVISPGTNIFFEANGIIVANGDVTALGTEDEPINLTGSQERINHRIIQVRWDAKEFRVSNANIEDGYVTSVADINHFDKVNFTNNKQVDWNIAIARFWNGEVVLENCNSFGNNRGEGLLLHDVDAPIVRNCNFSKTPDAVEFIDCYDGVIRDNVFRDMSDDAIDQNSCFQTKIINNEFYNVGDRALELGSENFGSSFELEVINNLFVDCNVGVNIKESSQVTVRNASFYNTSVALEVHTPVDSTLNSKGVMAHSVIVGSDMVTKIIRSDSDVNFCLSDIAINSGQNNVHTSNNIYNDPENGDFTIISDVLPPGVLKDEIGYKKE